MKRYIVMFIFIACVFGTIRASFGQDNAGQVVLLDKNILYTTPELGFFVPYTSMVTLLPGSAKWMESIMWPKFEQLEQLLVKTEWCRDAWMITAITSTALVVLAIIYIIIDIKIVHPALSLTF